MSTATISLDHSNSTTAHGAAVSSGHRPRWPLWGAVAGVSGFITTLAATALSGGPRSLHNVGPEVIDKLHSSGYHIGVVAGFVTVLCMVVTACGWRRWADERAPGNLAARVVGQALTATAGAMIIGFGFLGSLAIYLPQGSEPHSYTREGLFAIYMLLDFGPFLAWWGATIAAGALAYVALRDRLLPRWVGVVSALAFVIPVAALLAVGIPGIPGMVSPVWLLAVSLGMAVRRSR